MLPVTRILLPLCAVSFAYVASYCLATILPSWATWGGDASSVTSASLFFFPHGVRVLCAWLFGFWSILLLAPATYVMQIYRLGLDGITYANLIAPLFGVTCAAVAFEYSRRLGFDVQLRDGYVTNWRNVVIVGALASTINSIGSNIAYSNTAYTFLAFWVGDVIGLIGSMLILMAAFKIYRKIA